MRILIMTHQLHRGGHVIIALRLLRQTGSLDQLFPICHPLWSKAVGRHRVRSLLGKTHWLCERERALRSAHRREQNLEQPRTWGWNGEPKVEGADLSIYFNVYIFL